ncbi:MAG: hypothetical protein U0R64_01540 [Candidatus Nanopelagicales bacterium]
MLSPHEIWHEIASEPGSLTVADTATDSPTVVVEPLTGLSIVTPGGALWTKKSTSMSKALLFSTSHPSTRATYSPSAGQRAVTTAIEPSPLSGCRPVGSTVQLPVVPLMPVTVHDVLTVSGVADQPSAPASRVMGVPSLPVNGGAELPLPMPLCPAGGAVVVLVQEESSMSTIVSSSLSTPSLQDSGLVVDRLFALIITTESRIWSLVSAMASFM